jgi:hypothetical protein
MRSFNLLMLSDRQIEAVLLAAMPLQRHHFAPFLRAVAKRLAGETVLDDGVVYRLAREAQRALLDPPRFDAKLGPRLFEEPAPRRVGGR